MTKRKTPHEKALDAINRAISQYNVSGGQEPEAPSLLAVTVDPFVDPDQTHTGVMACASMPAMAIAAVCLLNEIAAHAPEILAIVVGYLVDHVNAGLPVEPAKLIALLGSLASQGPCGECEACKEKERKRAAKVAKDVNIN